MIKYFPAEDIEKRVADLIKVLGMDHVDSSRVGLIRSRGSTAYRTLARCHGMSKIMQLGMKTRPFYVIEVISEQFDRLDEEEQTKTLIHELMHIPKNFGGGFRHHDFVNRRNIDGMYKMYKMRTNIDGYVKTIGPPSSKAGNTEGKRPGVFRFF